VYKLCRFACSMQTGSRNGRPAYAAAISFQNFSHKDFISHQLRRRRGVRAMGCDFKIFILTPGRLHAEHKI
jgi:hypothetical protein